MSPSPRAALHPLLLALVAAAVSAWTGTARADFAPPPDSPYRTESSYRVLPAYRSDESGARYYESPDSRHRDAGPPAQVSTVRLHVGPALLMQPTSPGLFTALDIGQRAVGARLSAAWMRAESEQGLSTYSAELWIDFRHRYTLHPIVGAGASWLRGGALGGAENAGAGVLRGALEYELPVDDADARVSLALMAFVPAIGVERTEPWALGALMVGAGF